MLNVEIERIPTVGANIICTINKQAFPKFYCEHSNRIDVTAKNSNWSLVYDPYLGASALLISSKEIVIGNDDIVEMSDFFNQRHDYDEIFKEVEHAVKLMNREMIERWS